ncbi:hypothetical protein ONZ51_g9649 [Trametes cubensis]|uniref:Protein kinase domain-containing protein n=1 Tax=Trametes cubensis TaxID=1111947 RepID=A0AAD7TKY2_9APHY|nr:hypothetical protein ONZ51_g9649 [Trametes cubensis]
MPTPPVTARKRKRQQYIAYSEVQEVDSSGKVREVIVIDDTPPPSTVSPATTHTAMYSASYQPPVYSAPIRTRARAAAEAQALSASTSSTAAVTAPAPKKRKRDAADDVGTVAKKTIPSSQLPNNITSVKAYPSGSGTIADDASKAQVPCDDKEGHYIIVPDDMIYRRYRTVRLLGQGTFGKVVEAVDTETNKRVAIKIIRAIPKYRDASKIEVRVLQKLKERDPLNRQQLLGSVAFLHELHLIHTDLKPENILLVNNDYQVVQVPTSSKRGAPTRNKRILQSTDIRLIDFGSATFEDEYHSSVVSTRHYRAPEIILGLGWSFPCDAFSLGCILVEFYTGVALFQTHDNLEHLAMMEQVMGKMPERFARSGARAKPEYFKEGSKLDWPKPKATRQSKKEVRACRSLQEIIPATDTINRQFLDLVKKLLTFDPAQRITVKEALNHPYFSLQIPNEY